MFGKVFAQEENPSDSLFLPYYTCLYAMFLT